MHQNIIRNNCMQLLICLGEISGGLKKAKLWVAMLQATSYLFENYV